MKLRFDIEQNTDEWIEIKIGKFSASYASDLLMHKRNNGYINLINRIIEERITGMQTESKSFTGNRFTERGHEYESVARSDFETRNFIDVRQIGVIELDDWILCSPDGLVGDDGLYQAKCPIFNTQREYLKIVSDLGNKEIESNDLMRKISGTYYKQMQFELFVSARTVSFFNSYHPFLPPIDIELKRDEEMISEIKNRIKEAKEEIILEIKNIQL